MKPPQRILVALDGSPRAPGVLERAVAIAQATGGVIRLFHAVPVQPEVPWDLIHQFPPGGLDEVLANHAKEALGTYAKTVPPALLDGIATAVGVPWRAIEKAAADWNADLVVVGSHGYHGLDRVLGTTALKVVSHADRSVLVVR